MPLPMKTTKEQLEELGQTLKRWFTHDWEAKLVSLVLAFLVWYIVKDRIDILGRGMPTVQRP